MDSSLSHLVFQLDTNPPASIASINEAEKQLGFVLPQDYKDFLLWSNGGEGFIGESYLSLRIIEELAHLNKEYAVDEFTPGLIIFGSDGGGEAYVFDTMELELPIVNVPFIPMDRGYSRKCSSTFSEFLIYLSEQF
jgi:hypothetical protein